MVCCAFADNGHAAAVPPISVMNSRRRIASPWARGQLQSNQETATKGMGGQRLSLRCGDPEPRSVALGHKQPSGP